MAERIVWNGEAGDVWTNPTDKVKYQFIASLVNTCGVCLQYHMAIGAWWPIPMHYGCRCRQQPVMPGGPAPNPFVDFREILDHLPHDQQVAAIGAANYRLLKTGTVKWEDIVTRSRVRDLREVVSIKKLSVETMTKAGVRPAIAERAHASVHTPEHELVERKRKELTEKIKGAGLSQEQLVNELSRRLAGRVGIAAGPEAYHPIGTPQGAVLGPAWSAQTLPGAGPSTAAELARLIGKWRPPPTGPAPQPAREPPQPPGTAPASPRRTEPSAGAASETVPAGVPVSEGLNNQAKGKLGAEIEETLAAIDAVHGDGKLPRIPVESYRGTATFGEFQRDFYDKPIRIKVNSQGGQSHMTTAHEVGHFLDAAALPRTPGGFRRVFSKTPELEAWANAVKESKAFKALAELAEREHMAVGGGHRAELSRRLRVRRLPDARG